MQIAGLELKQQYNREHYNKVSTKKKRSKKKIPKKKGKGKGYRLYLTIKWKWSTISSRRDTYWLCIKEQRFNCFQCILQWRWKRYMNIYCDQRVGASNAVIETLWINISFLLLKILNKRHMGVVSFLLIWGQLLMYVIFVQMTHKQ